MTLKQRIARSFRFFGYDLNRYQPDRHPIAQLMQLMRACDTGLVLDIGANRGQYAVELRANGYHGNIVSFEPLSSAHAELSKAAGYDPLWETMQLAIGAAPGTSEINIAGNSTSSSLLGMLPAHVTAAPTSAYVSKETVKVDTVDRILPKLHRPDGSIWMKVDTQGFEGEVLKGCLHSLDRIACIQLEMSLIPLYEGSETFESLLRWMTDHDFQLIALQPGFTDGKTGQLLQCDGIFRAKSIPWNRDIG